MQSIEDVTNSLEEEVSFTVGFGNYCVGLVDITNSTKITSRLTRVEMANYYSTFLNVMSEIVHKFGGSVVKNIGDSLLFYFPDTLQFNKENLLKALECGKYMIRYSDNLNKTMAQKKLPPIRYRVSMDYGSVIFAKSARLSCKDLFGSTVNICTKINHVAAPNCMVIGNDLYQMIRNLNGCSFHLITEYSVGLKYQYPVYSVSWS